MYFVIFQPSDIKPRTNFNIIGESQHFRKLFRHIICGNIKMRYNVFRKYANDVFSEYDFMVQKLPKSYCIRLFRKSPALKLSKSVYCKEMMGLIGAGNNPEAWYDCCRPGCYRRGKQVIRKANYNELPLRA